MSSEIDASSTAASAATCCSGTERLSRPSSSSEYGAVSDSATSWVCHTASRSAVRAKARVMPRASSSLTWSSLIIRATRLSASRSASVNIASRPRRSGSPSRARTGGPSTGSTPAPVGHLAASHRGGAAEQHASTRSIRAGDVVRRPRRRPGQADILRGHRASSPSGQRDRTWITSPADTANRPRRSARSVCPHRRHLSRHHGAPTPPGSCTSTSRPTVAQAAT